MVSLVRRVNRTLSGHFPEKRLFIQSGSATRYIRLTPLSQLTLGTLMLAGAAWMAVATATVVTGLVGGDTRGDQVVVLQEAYRSRLDEMAAERDRRAVEARSAQGRFQVAMEQIGRQQSEILASVEERRELAAALDLMRARLQDAVAQRDTAAARSSELAARLEADTARPHRDGADMADTLEAVSGVLSETVAERDAAAAEREELAAQLADLELQVALNAKWQTEMVDQLEQAVAMSFGPLEQLFEKTELDVDALIASVRSTHAGQGGPLGAPASVSSKSYDDGGFGARVDRLLNGLDRMNLLRVAAGKIPYATPVRSGFRFTSGFGHRRDPKGGGRRMHSGLDMAGPRGTPIFASADGVVVDAGRESGYGNVVRIRHDFGFETLYAHQHRIRVRPGQQVSRGEHIGDMGSTGRSTGVHLHYEVHLNGRPVNPMTYLEAAKDVF